jgi:hypothetical protein
MGLEICVVRTSCTESPSRPDAAGYSGAQASIAPIERFDTSRKRREGPAEGAYRRRPIGACASLGNERRRRPAGSTEPSSRQVRQMGACADDRPRTGGWRRDGAGTDGGRPRLAGACGHVLHRGVGHHHRRHLFRKTASAPSSPARKFNWSLTTIRAGCTKQRSPRFPRASVRANSLRRSTRRN